MKSANKFYITGVMFLAILFVLVLNALSFQSTPVSQRACYVNMTSGPRIVYSESPKSVDLMMFARP
jgi:hypothetical protein